MNIFVLFSLLLSSQFSSIYSNIPESNCHPIYGRATTTTSECICLSHNCEGKHCQRDQGYTWYNYDKCPTCRCTAPIISNPASVKPIPTDQQHTDTLQSEVIKNKLSSDVSISPTIIENEDDETTVSEWILDNLNLIIGLSVGLLLLAFISLFLYMSMVSQSPASPTPTPIPDKPKKAVEKKTVFATVLSEASNISTGNIRDKND